MVALACGVGAAVVLFGGLFATGAIRTILGWMQHNAEDSTILAAGGAIYGVPFGIVLGVVIGAGVLLTEKWTGIPVFYAATKL
jgi:hypothetical protein